MADFGNQRLPGGDLHLLLDAFPGMAYRCSIQPPWELDYISPGLKELCTIPAAEFLSGNVNWANIVHPDDLAGIVREIDEALGANRQFTLTYRIVDPELGEKWVYEKGQAARNADGVAVALVGFITDITFLKETELRLAESEAHYRATVELSPQIPWTADPTGRILEVGPQWLQILGAKQARSLGRHWQKALHPADRLTAIRAWNEAIATGAPYDCRYRLRLKDKSYRWVRSRASARRDAHGQILKWYGMVDDIQDEVELALELRRAEERYALAAQATGDIIWDWNLDDGTIYLMAPEGSMLGYPAEAYSEGSLEWWLQLIHPQDRERVDDGLQSVLSGSGDRWSVEYRVRRADGDYAHMLNRGYVVPSSRGGIRRMVGAMQDVTDRKKAEEAVRQLEAQLQSVSQRVALAAVAATVAHELNQPLTAAANWLAVVDHFLESGDNSTEKARDAAARAAGQVLRAGEIVRRMRHIVSNGSPGRERTSLKAVVKNVRALVAASGFWPALRLRTDVPSDANQLFVDPIQIEQLLLNLIQNACNATPASRRPDVTVSAIRGPGAHVTVQVRDNGHGIPTEQVGTLFSRFGQSTTGGLGLGLAIARTIVEAHGGTIWASNNDDGGASIWFTMPEGF